MASRNLTFTVTVDREPVWTWLWTIPRNLYRRRTWGAGLFVLLYCSTRRIRVTHG